MKHLNQAMGTPRCNGTLGVVLAAVLAIVMVACTPTTQPPPPKPAPPAAPPAPVQAKPEPEPKPAPPVVALARPTPSILYRTIDDYKQALARHILSSNVGSIVIGDLQPLLRAVVVLSFQVDGSGSVRNIRTLRAPESEAERIARASLQRAGAVPPPNANMLQGGLLEVTETWLFNNDGKFHLRTMGPRQRSN